MLGPISWLPSWRSDASANGASSFSRHSPSSLSSSSSLHGTNTNRHNATHDKDGEDDVALTQFPAYGSLRPPTASTAQDWMMLGYTSSSSSAVAVAVAATVTAKLAPIDEKTSNNNATKTATTTTKSSTITSSTLATTIAADGSSNYNNMLISNHNNHNKNTTINIYENDPDEDHFMDSLDESARLNAAAAAASPFLHNYNSNSNNQNPTNHDINPVTSAQQSSDIATNGTPTATKPSHPPLPHDWDPTEQALWKEKALDGYTTASTSSTGTITAAATSSKTGGRQMKSIATANPLLVSQSALREVRQVSNKSKGTTTTNGGVTNSAANKTTSIAASQSSFVMGNDDDASLQNSPRRGPPYFSLQSGTTMVGSPLTLTRRMAPEDRQHWMPDQYCKQCYACATPFTVFRRRHHCRICGQVFCNPCAAYFVPKPYCAAAHMVPAHDTTTTTTTATTGQGQEATAVVPSITTPLLLVSTISSATSSSVLANAAGNGMATTTIRVCHECHQQVQQQQQQQQQQALLKRNPSTNRINSIASTDASTSAAAATLPPTTATTVPPATALSSPPLTPTLTRPAVSPRPNRASVSAANTTVTAATTSGSSNPSLAIASSNASPGWAATPKTQNVIQEIMQQHPSGISPDNMWHSLSQKSLLYMPELDSTDPLQSTENTRSDSIETSPEDDKNSEAETTTTDATANGTSMGAATSNLPVRPAWFPLQRGTSMGTTTSAATQQTSGTSGNYNAASTSFSNPPANPVPAQTLAVAAAEASAQSASAKEGRKQLGLAAANHLEALANQLLEEYAPLLFDSLDEPERRHWADNLLTLATRCCATVEPNVKNGDLIDIRPYCKIKVISGGHLDDCAYLSGVVFRKMVSHKSMAKELVNPRLLLLSGGIEFTRHENQIASFEALFEQEQKYMEILVGKILKLKPDVLLVGRFVSRKAHELLLEAGVVLIQHVKASLLNRIARQTGATVISSTDHIMNQFTANVLGKCHRFRLVVFRDNEVWCDTKDIKRRSVETLLCKTDLRNHERQAVLAASKLGQTVVDGAEAVRSGLAKRGVAQTYVMLEGCPKDLGCTIVLRGASRAALKQVKTVLRFLVMSAYSLRLETCYFKERCARIRPDFVESPKYALSTSLCVDFGTPVDERNTRPWNGGTSEPAPASKSGNVTACDHQSILITSVWMTQKSQCCPAEVKGICYYSMQDVALGQFLRDSCFNLSLKCQNPNCKKSVLDHSLSFVHNDGLLNILVEEMEEELPPSPEEVKKSENNSQSRSGSEDGELDRPIATWTYCRRCKKLVAPLTYISERTWRFSFGKFLETFFYNRDAIVNASEHVGCSCDLQKSTVLFFGCGKLAARFTYESVHPYDVFVRRCLPIELSFHKEEALQSLDIILSAASDLFMRFDKHIDRVSREARSLFQTAVNRPEHLQTVFSELNRIGAEVDHVARALQDKVASVIEEYRRRKDDAVSEALLRFPWIARRYLFMLTSAWNEKLSAAGQAITAMRKIASANSTRSEGLGPAVVGDIYNEELLDSMNRLRVLNERFSAYNVTEINQALPSLPAGDHFQHDEYDDDFEEAESSIDFADGVDADVMASRRRLQSGRPVSVDRRQRSTPHKSLGTRRMDGDNQESMATVAPKNTPGGAVKSAFNRFFNRGGREQDYYVVNLGMFAEGRPRLEPGVNGVVMPVFDEQWSSIIAYSLSSTDYASQFKHYAKFESLATDPNGGIDQNSKSYGDPSKLGGIERRMLIRNKTHIKHTFRDFDEKGQVTCKFVCTTYWATQFQAVREVFLSQQYGSDESAVASGADIEQSYIESLSTAATWAASGGKSGASFSRTSDHRFVIKCISRTELQMFLDCAPAYFEYLSKAFFHGLPTVLCKIVGVYQIGVHNRVTGKRSMEQVAIMQNIFYNRKITKVFDLKGSLRGRFARNVHSTKEDVNIDVASESGSKKRAKDGEERGSRSREGSTADGSDDSGGESPNLLPEKGPTTLLDGDFLEFTNGRPMPMTDRGNAVFQMSILNDTLFLSIINVLDYSILVGVDDDSRELVVGIIDFMRQYDILKQMERVGKSLPMVVGSEAPTIIQPPLYKARFTNAMERYFMSVPSKWTVV